MAQSIPSLQAGQVINETYEIERLLGKGGMGEVWLATHRRLKGKQVAIKVLLVATDALTPDALNRFRREAEIAARLAHPNIVEVLDFNTLENGTPYLVMELLRGESLAARLKRGPMPLEEIAHIIRHVGAALQVAHAAGVVHRDLKPENIFLTPTSVGDQVKVLDFGISKLTNSSTVQTTDSQLIGTPLYMSPEQALGNNREVGSQSDLFSLGSITYELLTGTAPFSASNIATVVHKIAFQPHASLHEASPHTPLPVVAAVDHALQKDKSQRTPDIETFVREMTGVSLSPVAMPSPRAEAGGVVSPGASISASMLDGATLAPSPISGKVTPAVAQGPLPAEAIPPVEKVNVAEVKAAPVAAPVTPTAQPTNPKGALWGAVGAAVIIAALGIVKWLRPADNAVPPVPVTEIVKRIETPVPAVVLDAGPVPEAAVDAGALAVEPIADAGKAAVIQRRPTVAVAFPPMNAKEAAEIADLEARAQKGEWESLRRSSLNPNDGPEARLRGNRVLLEARCRNGHDFESQYEALRKLGRGKEAKAICQKYLSGRDFAE